MWTRQTELPSCATPSTPARRWETTSVSPCWAMRGTSCSANPGRVQTAPIFPYNPNSVGTAFTRACAKLQIEDLCFHDLRHETTSRLFEQ